MLRPIYRQIPVQISTQNRQLLVALYATTYISCIHTFIHSYIPTVLRLFISLLFYGSGAIRSRSNSAAPR